MAGMRNVICLDALKQCGIAHFLQVVGGAGVIETARSSGMNLATVWQGDRTMENTVEEQRGRLPVSTAVVANYIADPNSVARREGHPVTRFPEQLHLHPAFEAVGWSNVTREFNDAVQSADQRAPEPILITSDGTILAGFALWKLAALKDTRELHCIEYALGPDEALRFLLTYHQPRAGWNAFIRIRLALTLEPYFQEKALANMREGGKYKGLANLPEAYRTDVRQEIAKVAGVGARGRNVSNVKKILHIAHPRLICALQDGTLTINRALELCKLPQSQQFAEFIQYCEERATMKVVRQSLRGSNNKMNNLPDAISALEALRRIEAVRPGSVTIRTARLPRTVILVGQDVLSSAYSQAEMKLT